MTTVMTLSWNAQMFIDDEILAERHRRGSPFPVLLIAFTTVAACLVTVVGTLTSMA